MSFPPSFIKSLFPKSDFPDHIGLYIKVKIYDGKKYIWFMSPLLKKGFNKIQYVVGKSGTYSQNIRHWLWREVVFNRFDKVKLSNGKIHENNGLKWNKLNEDHKHYFNVKNEFVDDNLDKWISKGGIEKTDKFYLQFVGTQEDKTQDIPESHIDKLEKRVDKLERLVNQLCKMIRGKETQIQTLKSLVKPTTLEEPEDKLEEPEDKLEKKTVTFSEEPKELPGPIIGKAKYLNEDLDWEDYDIVELLNEDECLLYLNGEKVGYLENYQDTKLPKECRDKDNYVINDFGEKLEILFIENKKKYYYVEEYNSVVGGLQPTNLCEIEYF